MNEIIKIVIKGESSPKEERFVYRDKITLTGDTFKYRYIPISGADVIPPRKWKLKSNSLYFQRLFQDVAEMITDVIDRDEYPEAEEYGPVTFIVTYSDGSGVKREIVTDRRVFLDLFLKIREFIPHCELDLPTLLLNNGVDTSFN